MGDLRAYAVGVTEVRGLAGATDARAEHLRTLARRRFAPQARPLAVRDLIGPIYRRVPGGPVLRTDDPTPADLDVLLAGEPVPPGRAAATWRLVEALVAGLAWSSTVVAGDAPAGLLEALGLALPAVDGLTVGWCPLGAAAAVPGLEAWLAGSDAWTRSAETAGRPTPDVLVFAG